MGHYRKRTNKIMLTACNPLIFRCIWVCLQRPTMTLDANRQRNEQRKITSDKWSNVIYVRFHATPLEYCANCNAKSRERVSQEKIASRPTAGGGNGKMNEVEGKCTRKMPLFFIIVLEMLLNEPLEFYDRVIYVSHCTKNEYCATLINGALVLGSAVFQELKLLNEIFISINHHSDEVCKCCWLWTNYRPATTAFRWLATIWINNYSHVLHLANVNVSLSSGHRHRDKVCVCVRIEPSATSTCPMPWHFFSNANAV